MDNSLAEITIDYKKGDKAIEINAVYSFKKSIYNKNEYARIKYYLNTIVKMFNEQIVFDKK
jgi:hypothetical protein